MVTAPDAWVYWAGLTSATHLVYGTSWIRRLTSTGRRATVVVEGFGSFLGRTRIGWDDVVTALADVANVEVQLRSDVGLEAPRGSAAYYLTVGAPGIKPGLRLAAANPGRPIRTVITDEGFSSYGTWATRRDSWIREGRGAAISTVKALTAAGTAIATRSSKWLLHHRDAEGWSVNPWIAAEFSRRVSRDSVAPLALFCTQPWVELGLVPAAEYTAQVLNVAETCRSHGLDVALRPHPAEDVSRYPADLRVLDASLPAELDPLAVNASVLLGATSSALINLSAIYGVPVVRVSPPQISAIDASLSRDQNSLLTTYLGPETSQDDVASHLPEVPRG